MEKLVSGHLTEHIVIITRYNQPIPSKQDFLSTWHAQNAFYCSVSCHVIYIHVHYTVYMDN